MKQLEPDCKHYTEVDFWFGILSLSEKLQVYEKSGLLGSRTILAHCVHLSEEEVEVTNSTKIIPIIDNVYIAVF